MLRLLRDGGLSLDQSVFKMIANVLSKIVKLSWLDHPELNNIVTDLMSMQTLSQKHVYISLYVIQDIIVEMSYTHRMKNLTINRRISISFRDQALTEIFKKCLFQVW